MKKQYKLSTQTHLPYASRLHKHSKVHSVCAKLPADGGVRVPGDAILQQNS